VWFHYTFNSSVSVTVVAADGTKLTQPLPRPSGLPTSTPWSGGVIGTINTRGYGQCTWYVAYQRKYNNKNIPYPAYAITNYIDATYVPRQWDVVDFGTKTTSGINGAHTSVIISPVSLNSVKNSSDGSTTTTYSFTIGEMNVNPGWGEQASSVASKFVVKVPKTGSKSIVTQIYSQYSKSTPAIAYFR
jgi:hypothetical protein